jgi:hydrogenase maturation protease
MAKPTLIMGIGNLLMGDEGVGCQAISYLKTMSWPSHVILTDGGTGGFHLLNYFEEYDPIVIIDACLDNRDPGSMQVLRPRFGSEFPPLLSVHEIGLRDLLEAAMLLGSTPQIHLIAISIAEMQPMSVALTPEVQCALPKIPETIRTILTIYD